MDENEEVELLKLLDLFVNPETSNENVTLEGKKVCLSGEFDFGSKKMWKHMLHLKVVK